MNFAILYWGTLPYILILTKECKKINTLHVKIVSSSHKIKKVTQGRFARLFNAPVSQRSNRACMGVLAQKKCLKLACLCGRTIPPCFHAGGKCWRPCAAPPVYQNALDG